MDFAHEIKGKKTYVMAEQYRFNRIDSCPDCHNLLEPYVRTKLDAENNLQWFQRCLVCHAEHIIIEEAKK